MASALRLRYRNREITTRVFMEELAKLRMSHDEVDEIAKEALHERKLDNCRADDGAAVDGGSADPYGGQFTSPADRKAYQKSVEWLANYHKGRGR